MPVKLIVDRREKSNVTDLLKYYGWEVEITTAELGDICSEHCIVERKEFNDFVSSIIDRRLFSQSKRMTYSEKPAFLLLHGIWDIKRHVTEKQVAGALASLIVRNANPTLVMLGHPCPKCGEAKEIEWKNFSLAMYIAGKICEKVEEGKFLQPKTYKLWEKPKVPYKVDKLARLLGVPNVVAARLLKRFGSIRGVVSATPEQWTEVEGVGDMRAMSIQHIVS